VPTKITPNIEKIHQIMKVEGFIFT
jgi:hypothetical protein